MTTTASTLASTCTLWNTHISPPRTRSDTFFNQPYCAPAASSSFVTELLPHRPRTPRLLWFVLGALQHVLLDHHPSPVLLPHLPRTPRCYCLAIGALQHTLVRPPSAFDRIFSSDPTPSGSIINLRRVFCTSSRSTIYGSECLQRHATGISAARVLSR